MNAVNDKKVCSRASREARMDNRLVGGIASQARDYSRACTCHPSRSERSARFNQP